MALRLLVAFLVALCVVAGQQKTISSSTRPGVNDNASGSLEGTRPEAVLEIVKAKGTVTSVDLTKRTVLFALNKTGTVELGFSQPAGREQLKAGKKAAKRVGKNRIRLEELQEGSKVRVQYYPLLSQVLEVVLD